ncbi:hypothetical protein [Rhodococcus sp. IEGM 1318]|uniref:hypothetical protein n=1 Tax=Rhodococcus sp. IEGM 1318 TaxID=3082226 RepID=UPI002952D25C|nr:hypothetical protein [Rhodococcus sp. IEGM 1318]MDV8008047.1 hypothetical protein [Rhodococcus sp. IEGM 1318]
MSTKTALPQRTVRLRLSGANEAIGNSPSSSSGAHGGLAINAQSGAETNIGDIFSKLPTGSLGG